LVDKWESKEFDSPPLAGGDLNQRNLYIKILVARALTKYQNNFNPN
jgi:hypothetical protein